MNRNTIGYKVEQLNVNKINVLVLGVVLLVAFTIINTSKYGASLSWVLIPCVLIILGGVVSKKIQIRISTLWIFPLWIIFVISTIFSDIMEIDRSLLTFLIFCVVYIISASYKYSKFQIKIIINIYIIVGTYCALNVMYNWLTHNYYNTWFERSSFYFWGVYKDPNYTMSFIVPATAFAFIKLFNIQTKFKKALMCFAIVSGISAMIMAGSRASLFTFLLFLGFYWFFPSKIDGKKKAAILLITGTILIFTFFFINKYFSEQSIKRFFNTSDDSRWTIWAIALVVFKNHLIIGGGMGAASAFSQVAIGYDSHNVYIDILSNSGLLGTSIFLLFFYFNCMKSLKQNRAFLYSIIIAFMAPMFFINGFNTATFYTPLILLTILSNYCNTPEMQYQDIIT